MKRYTFAFSITFLFLVMLSFPKAVFNGASEGLLLWFQIVLPTLLPFIIVSNLLIHTNAISSISRILGPLLKRIFGISHNGSFAVLVGFLCGYPMGAKVTSDLILTNRICKNEGKYLLSFCNNTSPMFIISYLIWQNLNNEALIFPSIFILFLSPVLCSFLFRLFYRKDLKRVISDEKPRNPGTHFDFDMVDMCIMNSFETITKVGGYIILFSVFITLFQLFPTKTMLFHQVFLPMLEITNGIPMLIQSGLGGPQIYIATLALTSFGGFCSIAQTKSMIQASGLSIFPYILEKLITAMVTSLLSYIYVVFILR